MFQIDGRCVIGIALAFGIVCLWIGAVRPRKEFAARGRHPRARHGLLLLILVLVMITLGQPRWGTEERPVFRSLETVWLCVDVSRSMLVADAPGNRLEQSKRLLLGLLPRLQGERVGLIAFAGKARMVCPATFDLHSVRSVLDELSPRSAPPGGSDWSAALRLVAERTNPSPSALLPAAIVLLVSDGGHEPLPAASVAHDANANGLIIFTVGLGDPQVAGTVPSRPGGPPLVERGRIVTSRLNEAPLRTLAAETGGSYLPVRTGSADLGAIFSEQLRPRAAAAAELTTETIPRDRFQLFLLPAIVLALWRSHR